MYKLIEYISDLLFLHDCVVIPDFGGFICNYKSAYIDEANGMICPPSKDILFNRNLTHNDGLLINWVASKENISYEKASKQVALFCEDLKVRLNQKQRVAFGDIGVFFTDRRFNVIFESGKGNFLPDTLGMEAFEIEKLIPETKIKPKQIEIPVTTESGIPAFAVNDNPGNLIHRLFKYALAITAAAGILLIVQLGITHFDSISSNLNSIVNISSVQPSLPSIPVSTSGQTCNSVISPLHDYVDYDPISEFAW